MIKTFLHSVIVLIWIGISVLCVVIALFKFWHHAVALPLCRPIKTTSQVVSYKKLKPSKVRLLSLNLFMLPGPVVRHKSNDSKEERLRAFCRLYLPAFDIVCLQECFSTFSSRYHTLVKLAKAHGHNHIVLPQPPSLLSTELFDSGTTILSRFPVLARGWTPFPHATWPNLFAAGGLMWALIDLGPKGLLNVFNLHLQSYLTLRPSPHALISQDAQLKTLWSAVKAKAHPGVPTLVCGDWNVDLTHAASRRLIWKYVPEGFSLAIPHVPRVPLSTHRGFYRNGKEVATLAVKAPVQESPPLEVPQWLDHIFYKGVGLEDACMHAFELRDYPYRCSDHDGVSIILDL